MWVEFPPRWVTTSSARPLALGVGRQDGEFGEITQEHPHAGLKFIFQHTNKIEIHFSVEIWIEGDVSTAFLD